MSILQEYEQIRRELGEDEWALINKFLKSNKQYLLSDVLYKERVWNAYEDWKHGKSIRSSVRSSTIKCGSAKGPFDLEHLIKQVQSWIGIIDNAKSNGNKYPTATLSDLKASMTAVLKDYGVTASRKTTKRAIKAATEAVDGYAVDLHNYRTAMHDLLLFDSYDEAYAAYEALAGIDDEVDEGTITDEDYEFAISDVFESAEDFVEEIDFRRDIDRNDVFTAGDDTRWQIVNDVPVRYFG